MKEQVKKLKTINCELNQRKVLIQQKCYKLHAYTKSKFRLTDNKQSDYLQSFKNNSWSSWSSHSIILEEGGHGIQQRFKVSGWSFCPSPNIFHRTESLRNSSNFRKPIIEEQVERHCAWVLLPYKSFLLPLLYSLINCSLIHVIIYDIKNA